MLTGLIVLNLICQCVFCRPEHNAKTEHNQTE